MADQNSSNCKPMSPSLLGSPRIFNGLLQKTLSDLVTSNLNNSTKTSSNHFESEPIRAAIGLALIDSLNEDETTHDDSVSKPVSRMALFGSKLKVQIPTANRPAESSTPPESPADFGIKTKNYNSSQGTTTPLKEFSRQLSLKEMELSEDYTCVITHGPQPKTTHIFDNCVVECCDSATKSSDQSNDFSTTPVDFTSSCKDGHRHGKDLLHVCTGERKPFASMNAEMDLWKQ